MNRMPWANKQVILGIANSHTANEWPVRIQYKCLVPNYVLPEIKLLFLKQNYNVLPTSSYTHIFICDKFIFFQDQSAYSATGKYVDRSWEYTYKSLTDT
jgi:hypothetical protein